MGGAIVTHISESTICPDAPKLFQGIVAIGAALLAKEEKIEFTFKPQIPILFLTNTDETNNIEEYIKKINYNILNVVTPSLWMVYRNGHCNVNTKERISAINAIICKINGKIIDLVKDNTCNIDNGLSKLYFDDQGAWGKILKTDAWGDILTNIQPKDMEKFGIRYGSKFKIELGGKRFTENGKQFTLTYGANAFLSVGQKQWYAYDHGEGYIAISANGFAHPSLVTKEANVSRNDTVYLLRPVGLGAGLNGIPGGVVQLLQQN